MTPPAWTDKLLDLGIAGGILIVLFFLGRLVIYRVLVPFVEAHLRTMDQYAKAQAEHASLLSSMQTTQIGISTAVNTLMQSIDAHMIEARESREAMHERLERLDRVSRPAR